MLLLKLKISGESPSVTSQIENTWTDKKYQILKKQHQNIFVNNSSNLWRFIYTLELNFSDQLLTT